MKHTFFVARTTCAYRVPRWKHFARSALVEMKTITRRQLMKLIQLHSIVRTKKMLLKTSDSSFIKSLSLALAMQREKRGIFSRKLSE